MSAPTARERLDRIDHREWRVHEDTNFLTAALRRALDALEAAEGLAKAFGRQDVTRALNDINALAARGETGGTP